MFVYAFLLCQAVLSLLYLEISQPRAHILQKPHPHAYAWLQKKDTSIWLGIKNVPLPGPVD